MAVTLGGNGSHRGLPEKKDVPVASESPSYDATLAEQRDYYNERAAEYDEWFLRKGRYDHGPAVNARWWQEVATVREALAQADLQGEILELAGGTGLWTERLAANATHVTVLDASPEMIAINRAKLEAAGFGDRVSYEETDLFAWQPQRTYDAIFTGFFLSHVPHERLDQFVTVIAAALKPDGRFFFVDSRRESTHSSPDQPLPAPDDLIATRRLNDGRTFQIIKIYWAPAELEEAFARHGLRLDASETPSYFIYGVAKK